MKPQRRFFPLEKAASLLLVLCLYGFLAVLIFRGIFSRDALTYSGDLCTPFSVEQINSAVVRYSSPWDSFYITGRYTPAFSNSLVFYLLLLPFSTLLNSTQLGMSSLLVSLATCSGFFMHLSTKSLVKSTKGALAAGLLYMLNPWLYDRIVSGHVFILVAYPLVPLVFAFLLHSVQNPTEEKYAILAGISLGLITMSEYHMAYMTYMAVALALLWHTLAEYRDERRKGTKITSFWRRRLNIFASPRNVPLILIVSLGMNLWWMVPAMGVLSQMIDVQGLVPQPPQDLLLSPLYLSERASWWNVLRLSGYWLGFFDEAIGSSPIAYLSYVSAYALVLICISYAVYSRNRRTGYFAFLTVGCLLLSMGTQLGGVYFWLSNCVPLFFVNIDPNKFISLAVASLSFLVADLFDSTEKRQRLFFKLRPIGKQRSWLLPAIIALIAFYSFPFFTGDFSGRLRPVNVSSSLKNASAWVEQNSKARVVLLPPWAFLNYSWTEQEITDPVLVYPPQPVVRLPINDYTPQDDFARWAFMVFYSNRTRYAGKLFGTLAADYFLARTGIASPTRDDLCWMTEEKMLDALKHQEDLGLFHHQGTAYVFKNMNALPEVYVAEEPILVLGDKSALISLSYTNLDFKMHPLLLAEQQPPEVLRDLLPRLNVLLVQPNHFDDLLFSLVDNGQIIEVWKYSREGWTYQWWVEDGRLDDEPTRWLRASANNALTIPIVVETEGENDLWVKVYRGPNQGTIEVHLGDLSEPVNVQSTCDAGFVWTRIGRTYLAKGTHEVILIHEGPPNALSKIAVLPASVVDNCRERTFELVDDLTPIYLLDGKGMTSEGCHEKRMGCEASNGFTFETVEGIPIQEKLSFFKPSLYTIALRARLEEETEKGVISVEIIRGSTLSGKHSVSLNHTEFDWIEAGNFYVERGDSTLTLSPENVLVDMVVVYPTSSKLAESILFDRSIDKTNPDVKVDVSHSLMSYSVRMENYHNFPIFVTSLTSFDKAWTAEGSVQQLEVWGYANLFRVETAETLNVSHTLLYHYAGGIALTVVFLACLTLRGILVDKQTISREKRVRDTLCRKE